VLLQADNLRFRYGHRRAARLKEDPPASDRPLVVDGVSVRVPRGSIVGILGPNGSGKTTLLKLLSGALAPVSGQVLLDELPLSAFSRRQLARRIAVVPQSTQLAFDYSALYIVLMGR